MLQPPAHASLLAPRRAAVDYLFFFWGVGGSEAGPPPHSLLPSGPPSGHRGLAARPRGCPGPGSSAEQQRPPVPKAPPAGARLSEAGGKKSPPPPTPSFLLFDRKNAAFGGFPGRWVVVTCRVSLEPVVPVLCGGGRGEVGVEVTSGTLAPGKGLGAQDLVPCS